MDDFNIESITSSLENGGIALVIAPSEKVADVSTDIVKYYTDRDGLCIYVSISRPCSTLESHFKKRGVRTENIFYLDCASDLAGDTGTRVSDNSIYLKPSELTSLSIAMSEVVERTPKDKERVLLFDTLDTLAIYNDMNTLSRFAHQISSRVRSWGIKTVLLAMEEEADKLLDTKLTQFVDTTIHID